MAVFANKWLEIMDLASMLDLLSNFIFYFLFLVTDNVDILGSWKLLVVFNEIAIVLKYIVCRRRAE